MMQSGLW